MIDKKQRINLRATFLLVCLLPTGFQIWWIVEPAVSKRLAVNADGPHSRENQIQDNQQPEKVIQVVTETKTEFVEVPKKIKWLTDQGIDSVASNLGSLAVISPEDLPPNHWLRRIPFGQVTIQEHQNKVALHFNELDTTLSELQWLNQQFLNGKLDEFVNRNAKPVFVKIDRLKVRKPGETMDQSVVFSHVQISFFESDYGLQAIIVGNAGNKIMDSFTFKTVRANVESQTIDIHQLEADGIPVWLAAPQLANMTGKKAQLQGSLVFENDHQAKDQLKVSGVIQQVDCATLTAYFAADQKPLANGSCTINVLEFERIRNQIMAFRGELQSSGGAISSGIVGLLGNQVKWVAGRLPQDFRDYRSFLFQLEYADQKLNIQSKYKTGKQLVWTEVADILVSNR